MSELFLSWTQTAQDYWARLEFGRENKLAWVAACAALGLAAIWIYRRDAAETGRITKYWLLGLRLTVIGILLVIALQPEIPNNKTLVNPSRVAIAVDTSLSMSIEDKPSQDLSKASGPAPRRPRMEIVEELFGDSSLIDDLRRQHDVTLYTFDSKLVEQLRLSRLAVKEGADIDAPEAMTEIQESPAVDWKSMITPRGLETRLGESLQEAIRREAGPTLAGLVVVSDGVSNTGVDPENAVKSAKASTVKIFPIGVGSTEKPVNLQVADVQCPTSVHVRDGFSITVHVRAEGLYGQDVRVELLSKPEGTEGDPVLVDEQTQPIGEDGELLEVTFDYQSSEPGRREFFVRARPLEKIEEMIAEDNESKVTVEINERKVRVLLIAGGPMRDYRFVRNMLFRDSSIELNVWLQTGETGISQESDDLLFAFPKSREELFKYDVILAFDADWTRLEPEQIEALSEWVFDHAGGIVLVAGDIYTGAVAAAEAPDPLEKIAELYPVELEPALIGSEFAEEKFTQAWPLSLTPEGVAAGFLQLEDNPATSVNLWNEFSGVFRSFRTRGAKAGATVLAYFSNPIYGEGADRPILLASQFYGAGRTMYLGSAEIWRLRALDENYYDRFWVQIVREVGQGRLLRGTSRGVLFLERDRYPLGSTVQVRARVLDAQLQKLSAEYVSLEVYDPDGAPLTPPVRLRGEPNRPGDFRGGFPVTKAGTYRLDLQIPESREQLVKRIEVKFPNLERQRPQQDVPLLRMMSRETGGEYLPVDEAAAKLPGLLKDQSITTVQTGFPDAQWDKAWVMYLLVGLLGLEWLTRKLLKLA